MTELQRDANRKYGFSAKQTSNVLQRLYEQHKLVTYPRTDSRYLTSDMTGTLKERLDSVAVGPYASLARPLLRKNLNITKRIVDDSKVTDHHAIIPTEQTVLLNQLNPEERKLYDLIVRRFISLFYPAARYDSVAITVQVGEDSFHVKGTTVKDSGWREVYGGDYSDEDDERTDEQADNGRTLCQMYSKVSRLPFSVVILKVEEPCHLNGTRRQHCSRKWRSTDSVPRLRVQILSRN